MSWDAIGVISIGVLVFAGLCSPLIPGPFGGGIQFVTRCETPAKFGYALLCGVLSAMLVLHFLAVRGLI